MVTTIFGIPSLSGKASDSKYFNTQKKGEIYELKAELNSDKKEKKKEAVKKVRQLVNSCVSVFCVHGKVGTVHAGFFKNSSYCAAISGSE